MKKILKIRKNYDSNLKNNGWIFKSWLQLEEKKGEKLFLK